MKKIKISLTLLCLFSTLSAPTISFGTPGTVNSSISKPEGSTLPAVPAAQTKFERRCAELSKPAPGANEHDRLWKLFDVYWNYSMTENPEWATYVGYPGQNNRWTDNSLQAIARRKRELEAPVRAIASIDRSKLPKEDQDDYDLFAKMVTENFEGGKFHDEFMPINQLGGVQQDFAQTLAANPSETVKDYEDMLARLDRIPTAIDQAIALLQEGLKAHLTPPKVILRDVADQIQNQMVADPDKNPLLEPFNKFPAAIPATEQERLRTQAKTALKEKIIPAFGKLHEFFVKSYLPHCRETVAWTALKNGEAWYAYKVRMQTTTRLTPKEIHEIGLGEVKRVRAEMEEIIQQTGFKGSFKEFSTFLRTDPRFYYKDPDELLRGYRDIAKRIDPELIKQFGHLPRLPYGVIPVPSYAEKSQTTAYYYQGSLAAGRPGYFYANTYALNTRPKWEMEALTLHEAVPGHHLQISLAAEMEGMPEFRKQTGPNAFIEGWGLYSESLGSDLGMYKDPYSHYGQLTYEMWRSIRLVVDTGMHALGWTRQQAIDYFMENSSKSEHDVTVEIDRYIAWPGQALAYKIGELKMKELRKYARQELGDRFDIREFHDTLLGAGAVPLDFMERRVKEWVANKKTAAAAPSEGIRRSP